jgi:hypothetical protein
MMVEWVIDAAGWIGAALLLTAYALVSSKRLEGGSVPYQLLNLGGGVLLALNSAYHGALPSVAVNAVWIVIGVATLITLRRRRARMTHGARESS